MQLSIKQCCWAGISREGTILPHLMTSVAAAATLYSMITTTQHFTNVDRNNLYHARVSWGAGVLHITRRVSWSAEVFKSLAKGLHGAQEFSYHARASWKDVMGSMGRRSSHINYEGRHGAQEFSYQARLKGVMGRRSSHITRGCHGAQEFSNHSKGSMGRRSSHIMRGCHGRGSFFNIIFVSSLYVPREPWRNPSKRRLYEHGIWYIIPDTARNRTHNLFRPKCGPIPLGHSDGHRSSHIMQERSWGARIIVSFEECHEEQEFSCHSKCVKGRRSSSCHLKGAIWSSHITRRASWGAGGILISYDGRHVEQERMKRKNVS